ncbi:MAG: hypothetical protein ABIH70_06275 [Chloroflexota bacterium]
MRRKRNSFFKAGILCLALMLSLGAMGVVYGGWTDSLYLASTLETGVAEVELIAGIPGAGVACTITQPDTLDIDVTAGAGGSYWYRDFYLSNTGSLPVKIQSISGSGAGVTVIVHDVQENDVIDAGSQSVYGDVEVQVPGAGTYNDIIVTITVVIWNQ